LGDFYTKFLGKPGANAIFLIFHLIINAFEVILHDSIALLSPKAQFEFNLGGVRTRILVTFFAG
jgi:hypothetical protein